MPVTTFSRIPLRAAAVALIFSAGVVADNTPAPAQTNSAPAAEGQRRLERPGRPAADRLETQRQQRETWIKEIGVSDEQLAKIREATRAQAEKSREIRSNTSLTQEERRAKTQEGREALAARMKEILTPEQYAKYETLMEQRRGQYQRVEGRRSRPDAPQGEGAE